MSVTYVLTLFESIPPSSSLLLGLLIGTTRKEKVTDNNLMLEETSISLLLFKSPPPPPPSGHARTVATILRWHLPTIPTSGDPCERAHSKKDEKQTKKHSAQKLMLTTPPMKTSTATRTTNSAHRPNLTDTICVFLADTVCCQVPPSLRFVVLREGRVCLFVAPPPTVVNIFMLNLSMKRSTASSRGQR